MSTLAAVRTALPPYRYEQAELTDLFTELCIPDPGARALAQRFHRTAQVESRHLALPIERYRELDGFTDANNAFLDAALDLGVEAVEGALADAGLSPTDVDVIVSTTVTGVLVPSLEARIAGRLGLRPDVTRVPLFGLGCLAGAAGVARTHDLIAGRPGAVAVFVSVELCSLTVQRDDPSVANMVASGLFGDGAAAVVLVGDGHPAAGRAAPRVIDSVSHLYPDTERAMGWDVGGTGLQIVLGAEVPQLVSTYLADDVVAFLDRHGLTIPDVTRWISHPGGPKVIDAIGAALQLDEYDVQLTRDSLRTIGNLSSASVLHVLADTLSRRPAEPGDIGVMMAMGPGFSSELVLLRW